MDIHAGLTALTASLKNLFTRTDGPINELIREKFGEDLDSRQTDYIYNLAFHYCAQESAARRRSDNNEWFIFPPFTIEDAIRDPCFPSWILRHHKDLGICCAIF